MYEITTQKAINTGNKLILVLLLLAFTFNLFGEEKVSDTKEQLKKLEEKQADLFLKQEKLNKQLSSYEARFLENKEIMDLKTKIHNLQITEENIFNEDIVYKRAFSNYKKILETIESTKITKNTNEEELKKYSQLKSDKKTLATKLSKATQELKKKPKVKSINDEIEKLLTKISDVKNLDKEYVQLSNAHHLANEEIKALSLRLAELRKILVRDRIKKIEKPRKPRN